MRKLYNYSLLFIIFFSFSAFAAEEVSKPIIIKLKTSQMSEVLKILEDHNVKIDETAFFSDFDDTLATTKGNYKGCDFNLIACPDRNRTYKPVFLQAFQGSPYNLPYFEMSTMVPENEIQLGYEVLDEGALELVWELTRNAGFVGVCSALPINAFKEDLMRKIGLGRNRYIYAPDGKPQVICEKLKELKQLNKRISAVVLLDNSVQYAIDPFLENMPALIKDLKIPDLKIIGIEYTKFTDMVTVETIKRELTLFHTLRYTDILERGSSENDSYERESSEDEEF